MSNYYIPVVLGTLREGRMSERPARFLHSRLEARDNVDSDLVDVRALDFPIFDATYRSMKNPPAPLTDLQAKFQKADAIVLVTPEYNGGYPAALKNVLDPFYPEFRHKPFGICTVSAGGGGKWVHSQLSSTIHGLGGFVVTRDFMVRDVSKSYDEKNQPTSEGAIGYADKFIDELLWFASRLKA